MVDGILKSGELPGCETEKYIKNHSKESETAEMSNTETKSNQVKQPKTSQSSSTKTFTQVNEHYQTSNKNQKTN